MPKRDSMAKKRKGKNKPVPKKAKTGGGPKGTASTASTKKAKGKRPKNMCFSHMQ